MLRGFKMQRIVFLLLLLFISSLLADELVDCLQPQCIREIEPSVVATPIDNADDASSVDSTTEMTNDESVSVAIPENSEASASETMPIESTEIVVVEEILSQPPITQTTNTQTSETERQWIILAAASVLLLTLVVLWFLLRRKLQHKQSQRIFAELVEYQSQGEVCHPLYQVITQLGRSPRCEIVFSDDSISAVHAVIKREENGAVNLIDLKSSNGVKVNNQSVSHVILNTGDMIELGETKLRYQQFK